ncbi:hypothetical protein [Bacillus manliponensis]|nr:hypothetical protein [Bacillus manliponensis]
MEKFIVTLCGMTLIYLICKAYVVHEQKKAERRQRASLKRAVRKLK